METFDFFLSKYGDFGLFFSLKILCILHTRFSFLWPWLEISPPKENIAAARMSSRRAIKVSSSAPWSAAYSLSGQVFSSISACLPEFSDRFSLSIQWQGSVGTHEIYQGSSIERVHCNCLWNLLAFFSPYPTANSPACHFLHDISAQYHHRGNIEKKGKK